MSTKIESMQMRYEPENRCSADLVLSSGEICSVVTYEPRDHGLISRLVACWNACRGITTETIEASGRIDLGMPSRLIADEIREERLRQFARGYTPDHDDEHTGGELVQVAADLCLYGSPFSIRDAEFSKFRDEWGLAKKHASDRRKQLVIAAALIFAEIERLDRAAAKSKGGAA